MSTYNHMRLGVCAYANAPVHNHAYIQTHKQFKYSTVFYHHYSQLQHLAKTKITIKDNQQIVRL